MFKFKNNGQKIEIKSVIQFRLQFISGTTGKSDSSPIVLRMNETEDALGNMQEPPDVLGIAGEVIGGASTSIDDIENVFDLW